MKRYVLVVLLAISPGVLVGRLNKALKQWATRSKTPEVNRQTQSIGMNDLVKIIS